MSVTSGTKSESGLGETIRVVIHALLIALVIRTFLFQPFNIPSGSMKATLLVGDYLFVSKYSYGYSHYSIPLSPPLFSGRIFGSEPNRGDIVVFRLPKDDSTDYIKRVIGLAGRPHPDAGRPALTSTTSRSSASGFPTSSAKTPAAPTPPRASSAGRKRCRTASAMNRSIASTTVSTTTPTSTPCRAGHFFMMGDNRDNSTDSRVLSAVGYVPFENIVGRAQMIFFSIAEGEHAWMFWRWPTAVRWNCLFSIVR